MKSVIPAFLTVWAILLVGTDSPLRASDDAELARKAETVFRTHCYRCHGQEGSAKGGLNFILDRDKLVARQKVHPGKPDDSKVYSRMVDGDMPPENVKKRPGEDELTIVKQWIEAGAPAFGPSAGKRTFVSEIDIVYTILDDLGTLEPRHRKFMRYLTLVNLHNAGASDRELVLYRQALSKLVNSLSWHPRITVPKAIDKALTIYRIDLRDYQWTADTWTRILAQYPHYIPQKGKAAKTVQQWTGTELPYLRGDWFVATCSKPPLYHDILQIPQADRDLERLLRVDAVQNIKEERVVRSGFNGSGIAKNNRLIERHDASYGAYWRSYDFVDNLDRQNLFEHPLGPAPIPGGFEHSGGEIIFHLPNGLQGYMLVDANGRRLDRAPIEIVSDSKRPEKFVENGISCMSCHVRGLHHKADQIRAHVEKNPNAFAREDVSIVQAIYPPEAKFKALLDEDVERFLKALAKTGVQLGDDEPVLSLTLRYEGELDLAAAASEVGFQPDDFASKLARSPLLTRSLGAVNVKGGTVQRVAFLAALPDLLREFGLGDGSKPFSFVDLTTSVLSDKPFEGHSGHVLGIDFASDGKRAVSASEDRTARLWDVTTGREIRPFEGHSDEVLAVAISRDGKRVLTGSTDRTMRLWDATSGRELKTFESHTERVSAVAFSPDGKFGLSGSWDQSFSLWNLETGEEVRRFNGHQGYVTAVAFSPDGKRIVSASYDKTVRLWDAEKGKELHRFVGHSKEVYCVAVSADGKYALSGGEDAVVRLWDLEAKKLVRELEGHTRAVIRVGFAADGEHVLTASSQYQGEGKFLRTWTLVTGREVKSLGGKSDGVWSAAFSQDGRFALTGSADKTLRLWEFLR